MCLLTLWLRIHGAPFTQFPSMGPYAYVVSAGLLPGSVAIDPAKVKAPTLKRNALGGVWDATRGAQLLDTADVSNGHHNGTLCTLHGKAGKNESLRRTKPPSSSDTEGNMSSAPSGLSHEYTLARWLECPVG